MAGSAKSSSRARRRAKRRIVTQGPSGAAGGTTTLARQPSGSRTSASGEARSTRVPPRPTRRSTRRESSVAAELERQALQPAGPLDPDRSGVDHHLGDARLGQQAIEPAEPQTGAATGRRRRGRLRRRRGVDERHELPPMRARINEGEARRPSP